MSYGHSSGRVETKPQFIDDATGPRSAWKFIELSNQSIQIVGNVDPKTPQQTLEKARQNPVHPHIPRRRFRKILFMSLNDPQLSGTL